MLETLHRPWQEKIMWVNPFYSDTCYRVSTKTYPTEEYLYRHFSD